MKKLPYIVSDIHPMFSSSIKKSLLVGASLSLVQLATAQNVVEADSIVVENGMFFGDGDDDPALSKDPASKDFHLDLAADGSFSMFRGVDPLPTFKAGEGNSADVVAGKWYRIAEVTTGRRANAVFNLRDTTSSAHNNITFRTGMSFNTKSLMNFTLLSNSRYRFPVFSEVRYLSTGTYGVFYLEVKIIRDAAVSYSIMENLGDKGFQPIDWVETPSIPDGYTETNYELDKLFVAAGETPVLSVDRTEGVAINGGLTVDGVEVLTANSYLANGRGSFAPNANGGATTANGQYSTALGLFNHADGYASLVSGHANNATGFYSTAIGNGTRANGFASTVMGQSNEGFSTGSPGSWVGDNLNSVFEVGIGTGNLDRKNALTIMQDGTIELGKDQNNEIPLRINSDGSVILNKAQGDISMGIYGQ